MSRETIKAGRAYDAQRHHTYVIGYIISGVQRFNYRGASVDPFPGTTDGQEPRRFHHRMEDSPPHPIWTRDFTRLWLGAGRSTALQSLPATGNLFCPSSGLAAARPQIEELMPLTKHASAS